MIEENKYKVIAVVGPTASGKSGLAIQLAKEFNGEIINADSRQIYKYLNIGTAKDPDDNPNDEFYTIEGIRHHLIDFVEPDKIFSVAEFQKIAKQKIEEITKRGKLPFLVGGTGLWIDAVCNPNYIFNEDQADWKLRKELEKKNVDELFEFLWDANPEVAADLNRSDTSNPVRLIRLIEKNFCKTESNIPNKPNAQTTNYKLQTTNYFYLSPTIDFNELEQRITTRVDKMLEQGLVEEIKGLVEKGYTFQNPGMSGIGYKEFEGYFEKQKTIEEVSDEIKLRTRQYAKRQVTWFKRNKNINYVDLEEARSLAKEFIMSS